MTSSQPICMQCGSKLVGRSDKKFCNDYCRNAFNNLQNSDANNLVRNINNQLRKNRRILESLLGKDEMKKTIRDTLLQAGFDFKYCTHIYTNQKGQAYYFLYEYGYLPLEDNWILIVKRKQS